LRDAAKTDTNLMPASMQCARVGVTVGEWSGVLREVFGEYRPPTGVAGASGGGHAEGLAGVRDRVARVAAELGRPLKFLVGKPGLDGHSNGAEQIAVRARDAGFEVVYSGIRLTAAQIVAAAVEEDVDVVGLSILSGSHLSAVPDVIEGLRNAGLDDVPVVVGGIIPENDAVTLRANGVARVFTPKDFEITDVLSQVVDAILEGRSP
jgi:(2R)-ethylmalonyl-CoA mutase